MPNSLISDIADASLKWELKLSNIWRGFLDFLEELKEYCTTESFFAGTSIFVSSRVLADLNELVADENITPPPEPQQGDEPREEVDTHSMLAWIKASLPNFTETDGKIIFPLLEHEETSVNYTWPPDPQSIWSQESLKRTLDREKRLSYRSNEGSVEAFFKHFSNDRCQSPTPSTSYER